MAASSSSSTPSWTYDVFLSFRGEDTRTNFVDHLYTYLNDRAIYTFKDDRSLQRGKSVAPELLTAIEQSRFAVVIFSRNYADSSWCLDELVKIVDCKNSIGQTVLPVFYDVDPSEVRKQTGCFGEAFSKHEINGGKDEYQIQRWRNALAEAATISGWDLTNPDNRHESQCIKQIVGNISMNLANVKSLNLAGDLIGMESRVQNVKSLLFKDEVHVLGILGMGGMGKTTLARAVFDDISNQFEGRSFVENVREVSKSSGLQSLQEKILSQILLEKELKVPSVHEGKLIMMTRLCRKRVLLILDDVDHRDQLEALAGKRDWFGKGSKIIITTRNKHLLVEHGANKIHEAVLLNNYESRLLFNRYAFKSNSTPREYVEPSNFVIRNVGGLPLALKVLGSFLYGRTLVEWEGVVEKLMKHVPNKEILDILKISFDGLECNEKEIFLDIACFFVGEKIDAVSEILDSFDFCPIIGLSVLIEKCLVNDSDGTIEMHDMIKELAWNIIYQMDPKEPGRRSRLWLREDVQHVFTNDTGTDALEGIKMHTSQDISYNLQAFKKMKKLRLLDVSVGNKSIYEGPRLKYLSNELRWIRWANYPLKSLPLGFRAEKLISLRMHYSNIVQLWNGKKILDKLKLVDLRNSMHLTRTPDFSGAPNLEKLILSNCRSLKEVHPSLGDLQRLTFLDLSECRRLKRFPFGFNMTSLEILKLEFCWKFKEFPQILGDMSRLKELYLCATNIKELHPWIGKLIGLVILDLDFCTNLKCLPGTIGHLKGLKILKVCYCSWLKELSETLGQLECLEELYLFRTANRQLPSYIALLKNLKTLSFGYYKKPTSLSSAVFSSRRQSQDFRMDSFLRQDLSALLSLKMLEILHSNLSEIPDNIGQLSSLERLRLNGNVFTCLPDSLCQLSRLKVLELRGCKKLKVFPKLPSSIAMLDMDECESLESLGDLVTTKHKWLHYLSFANCFKLVENEQGSSSSSSGLANMLIRTMLQGQSVIKNHEFSIVVPGREIPDWIYLEEDGYRNSLELKLHPDWDTNIAGFAMCCGSRRNTEFVENTFPYKIRICLGHKYDKTLRHGIWERNRGAKFESNHVWIGYISLDFLGRLIFGDNYKKGDGWVGGTQATSLRIDCSAYCPESFGKFGIHVVYKEDVKQITNMEEEEEDDYNSSSSNYANYGFGVHPFD